MQYAPHILYVKTRYEKKRDRFGRPLAENKEEFIWKEVCQCRCDDNSEQYFKTDNGEVFRPKYKIVCTKDARVKTGDEVRVGHDGALRAEGRVFNVVHCNFLPYSVVWV